MEKIDLMHAVYGKGPEKAICWNCHFCHWKISGTGEHKYVSARWCEIYGINKKDTSETEWDWHYPACGIYNLCKYPPKKNLWKQANSQIAEQATLF